MKFCDLHTHSTYSDGSEAPETIVRAAKDLGLAAVALTDHNTAKGLPEFTAAGEKYGMKTAPGCEFSVDYNGKELHIVGLFFPSRSWGEVEDYVDIARMAKENGNRRMIERLRADGYDVTYEDAAAFTDSSVFNRAHVAQALMKKGYVSSVKEAFDGILKEGNGYYVPAKRLSALTTVRFIKMYGARAILAHPFLNLDEAGLLTFLPEAKEAGLDAIETIYTEFTPEQTRRAKELAAQFGLLQSGGSDFHGRAKPGIALGSGRGNLAVPYEFYEQLKTE